mmetsp:Transcript_20310/g.81147  ORF Transcript_20310/g.81147 Transcript_20310/m.81147 type:complete len:148 (-) Transcript_20310:90-533(-)
MLGASTTFFEAVGLDEQAVGLVRTLVVVAGVTGVAIAWAWGHYGARIADLYAEQSYARRHHLSATHKTLAAHLSVGEALKSADWTRTTWHGHRRGPSGEAADHAKRSLVRGAPFRDHATSQAAAQRTDGASSASSSATPGAEPKKNR